MGWGNKSLFVGSGSHDQDCRHVHIRDVLRNSWSYGVERRNLDICIFEFRILLERVSERRK